VESPLQAYYIETYGCQMNEHDSEKMAALLESMGMHAVDAPDAADVIVINTCSIREKAEHKVYSALGKLKPFKVRKPELVTVVAGCVAQQERERLLKRTPHLDLVLGTHHVSDLPDMIAEIRAGRQRRLRTDFLQDVPSLHLDAPQKGRSPVCSYVTIMQGCSNFCAYCVVPYTRGPELSRPSSEIIREVRSLVERGVKEITLLGQNVNAYGKDLTGDRSFIELLNALDAVRGLERLRFTTSHPRDFTEELADAMATLDTVCEHIHLPLQSGSDRVLIAMGRGYARSEYMEKISILRDRIPDIAITADMIVGFPGETDADFEETVSALKEIRYDQIFSFKYSQRPGTKAETLPDQAPEDVKIERLARVHEVQDAITLDYHLAAVGSIQEVLIEGFRPKTGQPFGRTRQNKIVNIEEGAGLTVGELVQIRITEGLKHSFRGTPVDRPADVSAGAGKR
jgi:tRNA-2-methylthio-N6-dimethylallyladenosine synthase